MRPEDVYGPASSILITGASSGIGAALALALAPRGGRLALVARRQEPLQQLAARVDAAGGHALPLVGDVADPAVVDELHARLVREQGPVEVAFLNAGIGDATSAARFDAARVRRLFEVNVFGVVNWLGVLLPPMLERRRGIIAGTSSLAAGRGLPGSGAYAASKAALSTLLESLRADARRSGVQITVVEPGFVRTPMTDRNHFPMPFMVDVDAAARLILEGVAAGEPQLRFPWPMAAVMQVLSALPASLYDRLSGALMAAQRPRRPRSE